MGDVQNAAGRVRKLARALQFPHLRGMRLESGSVQDLLRLLHYALLDSSRALAAFLVDKGYDLYGKTDARFVESIFRLLRDEFRFFPSLSAAQFLSVQFVERRLVLTADILEIVIRKRKELQRQRRQQDAVWSQPRETKATAVSVDNHVLPTEVVDHAAMLLERLSAMQMDRSDSNGGRRPRVSRVRQRDAPSSTARMDQFEGLDDAARAEQMSAGGRQQQTQAYRATFSWNNSSHQSDGNGEDGAREDGHLDEFGHNGGAPSSERAKCSCSQMQTQSSPQQQQPNVDQALAAITQQLSSLSNTLLSKISRVEDRLGALETRVSDLHSSVSQLQQEQRARSPPSPPHQQEEPSSALGNGSYGSHRPNASDAFEKWRTQAESSCTWPSSPAMLKRY